MSQNKKRAMLGYFFILFFNTFVDLGHKIFFTQLNHPIILPFTPPY
ncbi:hypothetical protein Psal006b_01868 [Piscirickettsia salmonis]|uniref:Uncharacterized protein n=1 Tax=Piscirickettsia salmonis TaxID=1238 RepID=A0A9Q6PUZ3_PISSA|nr:hypothetical protein KW89_1927 [Piscirickettsia salmonis]ERL61429.1 hypothetical protein K661_02236 [Piscirickettsia salmonis LF-89 = ATCC VR-1361]ALB22528.1 hypothetical protein KU39_1346 [Piscirickettsia salmonis]QGN76943.1 hypothetical protein Psal001_01139 [Piscirickettsia salmonis]QGN80533.1 hypothetical protein Psal002_01164 [Piscirickettsia salmonis]